MATYYVGSGGNDANAGTSWALRKLTLNGAEDIPVAAGDTVYVGPGTYRETLTVDVSGSAGNIITYIGDYTGANTDGTGGVVRITGSDNDQTYTRNNPITATSKNFRTFRGFAMDAAQGITVTDCTDWIIEGCYFQGGSANNSAVLLVQGSGQARFTIRRCIILGGPTGNQSVSFTHSSTVNDTAHVVENCILLGGNNVFITVRVGGVTIRNSLVCFARTSGIRIETALAAGQTLTVNNCIVAFNSTGLSAVANDGTFIEDYNDVFLNLTARTNVATGTNSNAYPPLFDTRWFFEMVNAGTMLAPFDLASYSELVDLNDGTSPVTTDMRGTSEQGSFKEWGPLEYDSTLDIEPGAGGTPLYHRVSRTIGR